MYSGSKLEAFLIYFVMIPFLFKTDYVMHLWLGDVPPYAVHFAQCTAFISLTYALFEPIRASVFATNRITGFLIVPEFFYLLALPIGYVVSKIWNNPVLLIFIIAVMDVLSCILGSYFAVKVSPLKSKELLKDVLLPSFVVAILDGLVCYGLSLWLRDNIVGLLILLIINSIALVLIVWGCGLTSAERNLCFSAISGIKSYLKK